VDYPRARARSSACSPTFAAIHNHFLLAQKRTLAQVCEKEAHEDSGAGWVFVSALLTVTVVLGWLRGGNH